MSSISIFGLGYVGSVTAACLVHLGHSVIGIDVNPLKCDVLNAGKAPIVEARIAELIEEGHQAGRLRATSDVAEAIQQTDISFVAVGTPGLRKGKLDISIIGRVCEEIGRALKLKPRFHTVVIRSTVLPGTTEQVVIPTLEESSGKRCGQDFAVCINPEFLREGSAVKDFFEPPFTVLGAIDRAHLLPVRELYSFAKTRIFETDLTVAEMVKYASNSYHAVKVAFANEVGTLCREMGVDPYAVTEIFTADTKLNISATYLTPGFAFGGSCLPKDVRALVYKAKELDLDLPLLESVLPSNTEHIERAVQAVLQLRCHKVGMLGLSFKSGTDDLRESPSVELIKRLLGEGCAVQIWDSEVALGRLLGSNKQFIDERLPHVASLLCDSLDEVIAGAEVVVIGTRSVDPLKVAQSLRSGQYLIDLNRMDYACARKAIAGTRG